MTRRRLYFFLWVAVAVAAAEPDRPHVQTLVRYRENDPSKLAPNVFGKFSRMSYIGTHRKAYSVVPGDTTCGKVALTRRDGARGAFSG